MTTSTPLPPLRRLLARLVVALAASAILVSTMTAEARAGATQRESHVAAGGYRTLAKLWNTSAGAEFRCPAGARIRVLYGYGWLSKSRQNQTLDCSTPKRLSVGAWSRIGARLQIKVPQTGWVTWWYLTEGP